jgi:hypothetical protein
MCEVGKAPRRTKEATSPLNIQDAPSQKSAIHPALL